MKKGNQVHSTMLIVVGCYVLYIAYHLFESYRDGATDMSPLAYILSIIFFALAGIGVLVYAWIVYQNTKKQNEEDKDTSDSDMKG